MLPWLDVAPLERIEMLRLAILMRVPVRVCAVLPRRGARGAKSSSREEDDDDGESDGLRDGDRGGDCRA